MPTKILNELETTISKNTSQIFCYVLAFQWVFAVILALTLSPRSWSGTSSEVHIHVYTAILGGGLLTIFPIFMAQAYPENSFNKYIITIAQSFYSILLIHLTGGRIETHFHIFVSLAFLSFYRDFRPIILSTVITILDHFIRGYFWPQDIYGVLSATYWRALEHGGWVIFEDLILYLSIREARFRMVELAKIQSSLRYSLDDIEKIVKERTRELEESQKVVIEQQVHLAQSTRMSSLGEMAGGIAHEINNPLAIIISTIQFLKKIKKSGKLTDAVLEESINDIDQTTGRIHKIVNGLRNISRDSSNEEKNETTLNDILNDILPVCAEKFKNHSIDFIIDDPFHYKEKKIFCRRIQLSQVILNLLNNAHDAIDKDEEKWIKIKFEMVDNRIQIKVSDSGKGVPEEIKQKVFDPFFTTKEIGKGTGLGLSLSKGIINSHGGRLYIENYPPSTFVIEIPITKE